jgi:hypothetical protein
MEEALLNCVNHVEPRLLLRDERVPHMFMMIWQVFHFPGTGPLHGQCNREFFLRNVLLDRPRQPGAHLDIVIAKSFGMFETGN